MFPLSKAQKLSIWQITIWLCTGRVASVRVTARNAELAKFAACMRIGRKFADEEVIGTEADFVGWL